MSMKHQGLRGDLQIRNRANAAVAVPPPAPAVTASPVREPTPTETITLPLPPPAPKPTGFEYAIVHTHGLGDHEVLDKLNAAGADGWEVAGAMTRLGGIIVKRHVVG